MFDFMNKIKEAKEQMEVIKQRLEEMRISAESENGMVKVVVTGTRIVDELFINELWMKDMPVDEVNAVVKETLNKALNEAKEIGEKETKNAAKGILPNIPGLF